MSEFSNCPKHDCSNSPVWSRRRFVSAVGLSTAALPLVSLAEEEKAKKKKKRSPEKLVKKLYESLSEKQRKEICFDWDFVDETRGLLRTRVSNNWNITNVRKKKLQVNGPFFTADQQDMIEAIFFGLYNPEWHDRVRKQLQDDAGGYGKAQSIALFGTPGTDKFEFVMTGRHLTIRCDGNSEPHVAFGGPIFYGHAAQAFNEKADHPGNVYWHQAVKANELFKMLDGKQRERALADKAPHEDQVAFRGDKGGLPGVSISELSRDQKEHMQGVLKSLLEPYRRPDRSEASKCLEAQGGLDACNIVFYKNDEHGESVDIGDDGVWDVWRIEGPSFVWHYRGAPHVHVWINIAENASPVLNAKG